MKSCVPFALNIAHITNGSLGGPPCRGLAPVRPSERAGAICDVSADASEAAVRGFRRTGRGGGAHGRARGPRAGRSARSRG